MYGRRGKRELPPLIDEAVRLGNAIDSGVARAGQAFKYAQLAAGGFNLGRKVVNSFLQKEKQTMAPVAKKLQYGSPLRGRKVSFTTPRKSMLKRRKSILAKTRLPIYTTGKLAGRIKKHKRRLPKKDMYEKKGIAINTEYANTVDSAGNQTVIIGHSTTVAEQMLRVAVGVLVKRLFQKMNIEVATLNDVVNVVDFSIGDKFTFVGNRQGVDPPGGEGATVYSYVLLAGDIGNTVMNLIDKLCGSLKTYINVQSNQWANAALRFSEFRFEPVTDGTKHDRCSLKILNSTMHFYCKSDLKMQNRSVSVETDNQADNVNNVPVYGKSYEGTGTGFSIQRAKSVNQLSESYFVHRTRGIMEINGTSSNGMLEPLTRKNFRGVSKSATVSYNPGEIKTSTLISSFVMYFDTLVFACVAAFNNLGLPLAATNPWIKKGKFRFQILDKVIGLTGATGVKVAYEHNHYVAGYFKPGRSQQTTPYFQFEA